MDELTFRKQAYGDPNCKDPDFLAAASEPSARACLSDIKAFDSKLKSALKVEAPEGLAQRLILQQHLHQHRISRRRTVRFMAMAASVALVFGISLSLFNWQHPPELSEMALAHVYTEEPFTDSIDEHVTSTMVNAKLAAFGAQLHAGPENGGLGKVYFINYCAFDGAPGLHMILQGETGKITVFVIPDSIPMLVGRPHFGDQRLQGMVKSLPGQRLILVGEKGEPLEKTEQKLLQAVSWDI